MKRWVEITEVVTYEIDVEVPEGATEDEVVEAASEAFCQEENINRLCTGVQERDFEVLDRQAE